MKKYLACAMLFVLNNEVITWIALTVMAALFLIALLKEAGEGGYFD